VSREAAHARELHDGIATSWRARSHSSGLSEKRKGSRTRRCESLEILERSLKQSAESLADLRPAAISPDGLLGDCAAKLMSSLAFMAFESSCRATDRGNAVATPARVVAWSCARR